MKKTLKMSAKILVTVLIVCASANSNAQSVSIDGALKKWNKITLNFTLPSQVSENAASFKNKRMDVIFTGPGGISLRVPGYFAADGNAATSGSTSGKIYKAHLRPSKTGNWSYKLLFYSGSNVALKEVNQLPNPQYTKTGSIGNIAISDKSLPDLKAKGKLEYQTTGTNNQRRYLRYAETGEYFLKLGPDSPENFLDYNDFDLDASRNGCGLCTEHFYRPHASDYNNSTDPYWGTTNNKKGKNIIGAVNYLRKQKMNSISMSLFGGDDKNVYPWCKLSDKFDYDISKLAQWEIVFDHAEKNGLLLHFKLAEAENWNALTLDQIKVYYREMVARFGHHLGIEWNISEEFGGKNGTDPANAIPRINWLASIDPWQSHRVFHTYPGNHEKYYNYLINNNAKITGASIQSSKNSNYNDAYNGKSGYKTWINKSKNNNMPWVVASDEQNPGSDGMFTAKSINTTTVLPEARKKILWKGLVAGGAGVMWYGGGEGDFKTENFNRFNTMFTWTRYAILDFFKANNIEFWKMANNDDLASGNLNYCLAEKGRCYVIYLENGGTCNLNLNNQSGNYNVKWFDPRNGGNLKTSNIKTLVGGTNKSIGNPPNSSASDWVVLVTKQSEGNVPVTNINISNNTLNIDAGTCSKINATVLPDNASDKSITWTSSNVNVATVNANGNICGIAKGSAIVTVLTNDGNHAKTCEVTVTDATLTNTVSFNELPSTITSSTSFDVNVNYSASQTYQLVVILNSPSGSWLTNAKKTISAGSGTETITVNISPAPLGNNYKLSCAIRPVGGNWSSNIAYESSFVNFVDNRDLNLIKNASFDNGNLNYWTGWGNRTIVSNSNEVKVTGAGSLVQVISVEPNTDYEFSAQCKTNNGSVALLGVKEHGYSEQNIEITNLSYKKSTINFKTGNTNSTAKIYYYVPSSGHNAYADEFKLTASTLKSSSTIIQTSLQKTFNIYPNPASNGILNINHSGYGDDATISIYNTLGQRIMNIKAYNSKQTLDISDLVSGSYIVKIQSSSASDNCKLIIN